MKILMVCMGNICRSPMAEGILRWKAEAVNLNVSIDSAGTGSWHIGQNPDRRAIETAQKYGVDISNLVARQFNESDFDHFDRIYVMDRTNYSDVAEQARSEEDLKKVFFLLNADQPGSDREVPDPYYGGADGFVNVFLMMNNACDAIIADITKSMTAK